jgi:hypothetical protein
MRNTACCLKEEIYDAHGLSSASSVNINIQHQLDCLLVFKRVRGHDTKASRNQKGAQVLTEALKN